MFNQIYGIYKGCQLVQVDFSPSIIDDLSRRVWVDIFKSENDTFENFNELS